MSWERAVAENAWEVEPGLFRILLPLPFGIPFVAAYVLASGGEHVLIDCGTNWLPSLRALGRALKGIGVPSGGLAEIVLTHAHTDHADAARSVQERWGGTVRLHPAEKPRAAVPTEDFVSWLARNGVDPPILEMARQPARDRSGGLPDAVEPLAPDRPVRLGDLLLDVLEVPGHSPGQVMLLERERGWIFTADHVLPVQAPNAWLFPGAEGDPFGDYLASLERSLELDVRLALPGHGMPIRHGLREATAAMHAYQRTFADRVRASIRDRPLKAWEIVKRLDAEVPADPNGARFSLAQVLAVLAYLERRGEAARDADHRWMLPARTYTVP